MRSFLTFLLGGFFFLWSDLSAQNIGVNGTGNNPDPSAMLHVEAGDKGLLIPRVALNDTATEDPITSAAAAEGLVIYNETGSEPKGFYYWDDSKGQWIQVGTGADDLYWDRDPSEGELYPSNLGDSIGIGTQEPIADLDVRGRDVDLGSNRAAVKVLDESDGDTLYMDGDEIAGGLGGSGDQALYLQLGTSEDLVLADGPAQVGIGDAANYPRNNIKLDVDHENEDIAMRGESDYSTYGYVGVQGSNNFDGIGSADWSGHEIGLVGISTGSSTSDNYGVIGHSNNWGGYFEHTSSGNFVRLGGDAYAARIVDGNEADGYILTSDANGNAVWEDPANISSVDTLRDNDWYYESSDSSMLRDYGTEEDCVLVGTNTGSPSYPYEFAVHNGNNTGTGIGLGSVERLIDESDEVTINDDFSPASDATENLGANARRWANVFGVDFHVDGGLFDNGGADGVAGDVLISTGTGVDWVDPSSINDDDWDRDAGSGELFPSNIGDQVGIMTTNPGDPLDVRGQVYIQGNSDVGYTTSKIDLAVDDDDSGLETPGDGKLFLMADNDSAIKINQKGFDEYGFIFNDDGAELDLRVEGGTEEHLIFTDAEDDQVGIGSEFPAEDLEVEDTDGDGVPTMQIGYADIMYDDNGEFELVFTRDLLPDTDGGEDLGMGTYRWGEVFAQNGTINTSDRRDKTEVKDLEKGVDELMKLNPVSYEWKKGLKEMPGRENRKLGLVAQEVKPVIQEVVKSHNVVEDEDGNKKLKEMDRLGIYYSDLIPVLIKAIQEQQKQIEKEKSGKQELEGKVEKLQKKNKELERRLDRLEEKLDVKEE